jgi:hypothetical protein
MFFSHVAMWSFVRITNEAQQIRRPLHASNDIRPLLVPYFFTAALRVQTGHFGQRMPSWPLVSIPTAEPNKQGPFRLHAGGRSERARPAVRRRRPRFIMDLEYGSPWCLIVGKPTQACNDRPRRLSAIPTPCQFLLTRKRGDLRIGASKSIPRITGMQTDLEAAKSTARAEFYRAHHVFVTAHNARWRSRNSPVARVEYEAALTSVCMAAAAVEQVDRLIRASAKAAPSPPMQSNRSPQVRQFSRRHGLFPRVMNSIQELGRSTRSALASSL